MAGTQSSLQQPLPMDEFGMIRRECFAIDVFESNNSKGETLKPGTLIQIIPNRQGDECHFKVWELSNWLDKYKTKTYKCSKEDYILLNNELFSYVLTIKRGGDRIKFVQNIATREFDVKVLQIGYELRIRRPPGTDVEYYEFVVTYNGVIEENGIGYYIGLQLKNNDDMPIELMDLSQNYRFGGIGIIVPADWIMLNLYKNPESQVEPLISLHHEKFTSVANERTENFIGSIQQPSSLLDEPHDRLLNEPRLENKHLPQNDPFGKTNIIVQSEEEYQSEPLVTFTQEDILPVECVNPSNVIENVSGSNRWPSTLIVEPNKPIENLNIISGTGTIPKPHHLSAEIKYDPNYASEIELVNNADRLVNNIEETKCDLCAKIVEIGRGIILRECLHSFCFQCLCDHIVIHPNNTHIKCPYFKEYECKSNLWDIEIKGLQGDIFYNKILDNRLKEYMGPELISRTCLYKNCKNNWYSSTNASSTYEKCPKCQKSWHKSTQERNKRHGHVTDKSVFNTSVDGNKHTFLGTESSQASLICAKCNKSIIRQSESIQLQNCKHMFCKDCIVSSIKTQTSLYPVCIICKKRLNDIEVEKITGFEVLNLFQDGREEERVKASTQLCSCFPPISNCGIVLKCNHKICREFLKTKSSTICPICLKKIDEHLMKQLDDKMKTNIIDKCPTCIKPAVARLKKCGHSFCQKCISDLIKQQTLDPSKLDINCSVCNYNIIESDILQYGGETMLVQFKSKIGVARVDRKSIENVTLNDWPDYCVSCKKQFSIKCCIILSRCQHIFCQPCFNEVIVQQLSSSQTLNCPICLNVLPQFEVDAIMKKIPAATIDFTNLVECLKCETKFEKRLIHQCLKCTSSLCLECANSTILYQITNNREPFCSFCENTLDESQIVNICFTHTFKSEQKEQLSGQCQIGAFRNTITSKQHPETNQSQKTNSEIKSDTCVDCFEKLEKRIDLKNCGHAFCHHCLEKRFTVQQTNRIELTCPKCHIITEHEEITETKMVSSFPHADSTQLNRETQIPRQNNGPWKCELCSQNIEPCGSVILTNCGHLYCSSCIMGVILMLSEDSLLPKCALCEKAITDKEFAMFKAISHAVFAGSEPNRDNPT